MSLVPCFPCSHVELEIRKEIGKAERARSAGRETATTMTRIAALKVNLARCDHESMEKSKDAARARHAAGRAQRADS